MASIRIGIASEFNLVDSKVGVGTTNPTEAMDVRGQIYSDNSIGAGGISTVTTYQGFLDTKQTIKSSVSEGTVVAGSLSGEIVIEGEVTVSSGTTYRSGVDDLTVTDNFTLPGISDDKPSVGTMRFNENLAALEFYTGVEWRAVNSYVDMGSRGRAVVGGGYDNPVLYSDLEYFSISSGGSAVSFGDMSSDGGGRNGGSMSSSTRGVFATGYGPSPGSTGHNVIDYITIASTGDAIDFGDASGKGYTGNGCSSSTRGVYNLGYIAPGPNYNSTLDYVEIATVGSRADYGDLSAIGGWNGATASPTRGFFGGFYPRNDGVIDVIKFASTGTAVEFGTLFVNYGNSACSNSVRAIFAGGTHYPSPGYSTGIQSVIMASDGTVHDFGETYDGNLTYSSQGVASQTRGCIVAGWSGSSGGSGPTTEVNTIQEIDFNSGGRATYFGDLRKAKSALKGVSDSHGGLGGY